MNSSTSSFKAFACGIAALVAALVAAQVILHAVFFRKNFQSMAVDALGPQTETLVIGSSRVFFGIDPSKYGSTVMTLAADYLDLSTAEELWHFHRAKVPRLKRLVLEFGVATLRYDTRRLEPYACYHLGLTGVAPWRLFLEDFDAAVHRSLSPLFKWRLTPLFWGIHKDMMTSTLEPIAAQAGFVPTGVEFTGEERVALQLRDETAQQMAAQDPAVHRRNFDAGMRLIADANRQGVEVVLLRFPKAPVTRKNYPEEWDAIVSNALGSMESSGLGLKYEMIDLNRDERFPNEDFRDPDHLNRRGAAHLSEILGPRLTR